MTTLGKEMHDLCRELFPICRSITGNGFRQSLALLKEVMPTLKQVEVPTGTQCFDWQVPKEWNIRDAYIVTPRGEKICDFNTLNLHVVGYSTPVDKTLSLEELQAHLYSLPEQPTAVPYVTSYYKERWGFCLSHEQREQLEPGEYRVFIDSELSDGALTYGELIIPGEQEEEIFLSSYLCHPSMANNELSGPVVTSYIAKWLMGLEKRKYTYRIVIVPETIGSIAYLSRHYMEMKKNVVAGFNITCIGDERAYSYLPSRQGQTLADKAALHALSHMHPDYVTHSFLDRGSDERQYCSPGIDLPVCSIMRTKYACYPEYHTSLDDLSLVTPNGLFGGYEVVKNAILALEYDEVLRSTVLCEPQLGKRGLYPSVSTKNDSLDTRNLLNFIAYIDGCLSCMDIANIINVPIWKLKPTIDRLKQEGLVVAVDNS